MASHTCAEPGCSKAFSSPSHLRRHARNHKGDRSFACGHCGRSFVRREVWKRHEELHLNPQSHRPRIKPIVGRHTDEATRSESPGNLPVLQTDRSITISNDASGYQLDTSNPITTLDTLSWSFTPDPIRLGPWGPTANEVIGNSIVGPDEINAAPTFDNIDMTTGSFPPELGIESWLDQILSDQASFPGVTAAMVTQTVPAGSEEFWSGTLTQPGPATHDNAACVRLREWLEDTGRSQCNTLLTEIFGRSMMSYWARVDVQYPIVHRVTFLAATAPPLLLLTMVIAGATASDDNDARAWAESVLPHARGQAVAAGPVTPQDRLQVLQAIVLLSIAGHGMDLETQDHSHALISFALTLARRANLYEDRNSASRAQAGSLESQWTQWVLEESMRRVGWVILIRDIEYATFFQQLPSRATSPFRLPVDLPCSEKCWEAPTAESWSLTISPGETLAAALKKALLPRPSGGVARPPQDTLFAELVLTYGLCALGWDVNRRDLIAPEISKSGPSSLNTFLVRSFTTSALDVISPGPRTHECLHLCIQDAAFLAAVDLHISMLFLQVFVGVTEVGTLQPVRPTDWIEASKAMRKWAAGQDSVDVVAFSAQFLSQAIKRGQILTLNHAWAIYIAYLVVWSYYVLLRNVSELREQRVDPPTKDDALRCCQAFKSLAADRVIDSMPETGLMGSLSTQVVILLSSRHEYMITTACKLVDRIAVP